MTESRRLAAAAKRLGKVQGFDLETVAIAVALTALLVILA